MKFIITYEKSYQVSDDQWRCGLRSLLADENTTLGQIKRWYNSDVGYADGRLDDIRINEPEVAP